MTFLMSLQTSQTPPFSFIIDIKSIHDGSPLIWIL